MRDLLFRRHIASLNEQERQQIMSGTHPSQTPEAVDAAEPYAHQLAEMLKSLGYDCEVTVNTRQGGLLGLGVQVCAADSPIDLDGLPEFYHGFQVSYCM